MMVQFTLLRNSKCVLFEKESNGFFSEEFYNRFFAVGHTSIQILTIQLTMYVSLGKLLCLWNITFHISIMGIIINSCL